MKILLEKINLWLKAQAWADENPPEYTVPIIIRKMLDCEYEASQEFNRMVDDRVRAIMKANGYSVEH
jgi:hypothetical protein